MSVIKMFKSLESLKAWMLKYPSMSHIILIYYFISF